MLVILKLLRDGVDIVVLEGVVVDDSLQMVRVAVDVVVAVSAGVAEHIGNAFFLAGLALGVTVFDLRVAVVAELLKFSDDNGQAVGEGEVGTQFVVVVGHPRLAVAADVEEGAFVTVIQTHFALLLAVSAD